MRPVFRATVKKGKVVVYDVDTFDDYVSTLEKKDIDVIIRKHKKSRSLPQNKYYWGVMITTLCDETGYSDDEMHSALKLMFLKDNSRKIPIIKSTPDLTTVEFEDYLEKVRVWAASELNCSIPLPNEVEA